MRLRHIEVFQAVYTSGSVTQAAKILHVSQPSISKVLSHAESQLGFLLFERAKGKLVPTPEAQQLFQHVQVLFDDLGKLRRIASSLKEGSDGKIRIASTPALGTRVLPRIVAQHMKTYPGIRFELETLHHREMTEALKESRLDLAVAFDPPSTPGIKATTLDQGEFVLIAPKNTMKPRNGDTIELTELEELPFVALSNRGPLGGLLDAHVQGAGIDLNTVAEAETYHLAAALVSEGVGVAIVDNVTADNFLNRDVDVLKIEPTLQFDIALLQLEQVPVSTFCQRFIDFLSENIEQSRKS